MKRKSLLRRLGNQKGVTIVVVAIVLVVLIGFAALAIDLGYLYIVRGELQNAADSGALAGAQVLYITVPLGIQVNPGRESNGPRSGQRKLQLRNRCVGEIDRARPLEFCTRTFTPNNSLLPVSLWNVTSAQLDANPDFINAVRVVTQEKSLLEPVCRKSPFLPGSSVSPVGLKRLPLPISVLRGH